MFSQKTMAWMGKYLKKICSYCWHGGFFSIKNPPKKPKNQILTNKTNYFHDFMVKINTFLARVMVFLPSFLPSTSTAIQYWQNPDLFAYADCLL
jgi:hypothetical protein